MHKSLDGVMYNNVCPYITAIDLLNQFLVLTFLNPFLWNYTYRLYIDLCSQLNPKRTNLPRKLTLICIKNICHCSEEKHLIVHSPIKTFFAISSTLSSQEVRGTRTHVHTSRRKTAYRMVRESERERERYQIPRWRLITINLRNY